MSVDEILKRCGGVAAVASKLNIHHTSVMGWRRRKSVPVKRALEIERHFGIPRHRLRPDLWDPPPPRQDAA